MREGISRRRTAGIVVLALLGWSGCAGGGSSVPKIAQASSAPGAGSRAPSASGTGGGGTATAGGSGPVVRPRPGAPAAGSGAGGSNAGATGSGSNGSATAGNTGGGAPNSGGSSSSSPSHGAGTQNGAPAPAPAPGAGAGIVLYEGFDTVVHVGVLGAASVTLPSGDWRIGFTAGSGADWEIGMPLTISSQYPNSGMPLPPYDASGAQVYAGAGCAGTIIYGEYYAESGGRLSFLQSPVVDLSGVPEPTLEFYHCYEIEKSYDGAFLEISTDGGARFRPIPEQAISRRYDGRIDGLWDNPRPGEKAWWGWLGRWTRVRVDLARAAGQGSLDRISIRFVFSADRDESRVGWYIDEVRIGARAALP